MIVKVRHTPTARFGVAAAMTALGFAFSLAVFYPGVMTYDSGYVHDALATGNLGDWQSPVMTVLWAAIDPIAPGPASMFLLIAALYWLGFFVLVAALSRRSSWPALVVPLLGLAPPAFCLMGIIWRDVLFAALWLNAAALGLAVARSEGGGRIAAQAVALALVTLGLLLRPNALFAAPILGAAIAWPRRFSGRRMALLYLPAAALLFGLTRIVFYDVIGAREQHPIQSIMVFDLGGISHFTGDNQFPGTWTPAESSEIALSCYQPTEWDIYWWRLPCSFVMKRLEAEKIFGTPALSEAWRRVVLAHPLAYLQHRAAFMANFLFGANLTMWTEDTSDHTKTVYRDRPLFMALKGLHDALKETPLFRVGAWLLLDGALVLLAWRRRGTPEGAFAVGTCLSAVAYVLKFTAIGVADDFRYAYWAVLAGLAGGVVTLTPSSRRKPGSIVPTPWRLRDGFRLSSE
ncbi:MAG: hypothetical protein JO255_19240 [Alphaproteobacteria bacterium]|nr:hypothetical protein [Alphaproteobacteria bacterium]